LANDTDDEGFDISTVQILTQPKNGSVVVNVDGTITYTPKANYEGQDSFEYAVNDTGLSDHSGIKLISNPATVTISVSSVNDAPTAVADSFTLDEDSIYSFNVLLNDADVDNDLNATGITIVTQPTHGSVNFTDNGLIDTSLLKIIVEVIALVIK